MMRLAVFGLVAALLLLGSVVLYPTSVPASTYVGTDVPTNTYIEIKQELLSYAKANQALGVTATGDADSSGSVSLTCKQVPLIMLSRAGGATFMQVSLGAYDRAPGVQVIANVALSRMRSAGPVGANDRNAEVSSFQRMILKYRDGIDLDQSCKETSLSRPST
jgi:hypothetical protein